MNYDPISVFNTSSKIQVGGLTRCYEGRQIIIKFLREKRLLEILSEENYGQTEERNKIIRRIDLVL